MSGRRAGLALAGGLALYAGHPPLDLWWLAFVALVPLLALARDVALGDRPIRAGAAWGMLAGVAFFGPLLEWVRLVDPLALAVLVLIESLFVGAFVAGLAAWGPRRGWAAAAVLWWVALEALRGRFPVGGFPWGALGYTQAGGGPALPLARLAGVLGISALLATTSVLAFLLLRRALAAWRARSRAVPAAREAGVRARPVAAGGAAMLALAVLLALPAGLPAPAATGQRLDLAAVQGLDVEGSTGRALPRSLEVADAMVEVTRRAVARGRPQLTVWPENALDGDLQANPQLRSRLDAASDLLGGGPLLAGVVVDGPAADQWMNTVVLFEDGAATERYVKRRPVPFGEYIPLRPLIDWYPTIQRLRPTDAVRGTGGGLFDTAGARLGVVICFESIFPSLVHGQVRDGAEVLLVATNNSSFGRSAASEQHLAFTRMRAVESGRWVVHAALSGISAIVGPDGEVRQRTGLYEQAVLRADVPLVRGLTPATRLGEAPAWLTIGAAALGLAWLARDRRRRAGAGVADGDRH